MRAINLATIITFFCSAMALSITGAAASSVVSAKGVAKGTILIKTGKRRLYYGLGNGKAVVYRVGVGRRDKQWTGTKRISSKRIKPARKPTKEILRDKPSIRNLVIPGGSSRNPMGAAALLLSGSGSYAIHGTNKPGSVGGFVSYGCIRMLNSDIRDLYSRVSFGTKVTVTR